MKNNNQSNSNNQEKKSNESVWTQLSQANLQVSDLAFQQEKAQIVMTALWSKLSQANMLDLGRLFVLTSPAFSVIEDVKDKKIVPLIGDTGVGKSTIANYILGVTYRYSENSRHFHYAEALMGTEHARVGHGVMSETLSPQIFKIPESDFYICDTPGLHDTRDREELICATITTQAMFNMSAGIKATFAVASLNSLFEGRGSTFRNFSEILHKILIDSNELSFLLFAFTHTDLKIKQAKNIVKRQAVFFQESISSYEDRIQGPNRWGSEQTHMHKILSHLMSEENIIFPDIFDSGVSRELIKKAINESPAKDKVQLNITNILEKNKWEQLIQLFIHVAREFLDRQQATAYLIKEATTPVLQSEIIRNILEIESGHNIFDFVFRFIGYLHLEGEILEKFYDQFSAYKKSNVRVRQIEQKNTTAALQIKSVENQLSQQALSEYKKQWDDLRKFDANSKQEITDLIRKMADCYLENNDWDDCRKFVEKSKIESVYTEAITRLRAFMSRTFANELYSSHKYDHALTFYDQYLSYSSKFDTEKYGGRHYKLQYSELNCHAHAWHCKQTASFKKTGNHDNTLSHYEHHLWRTLRELHSTEDSLENAVRNLQFLGASYDMDLDFDNNFHCKIKTNDETSAVIFVQNQNRIYIITPLSKIPEDNVLQLKLYQHLLQRLVSGEIFLHGIISIAANEKMVLLQLPVDMHQADAFALSDAYCTWSPIVDNLRASCEKIIKTGIEPESLKLKSPAFKKWNALLKNLHEEGAVTLYEKLIKDSQIFIEKNTLDSAKKQLADFGEAIALKNLTFGQNNTCILAVDNIFSLHLTYIEPGYLYLYAPILNPLPKDSQVLLRIYEALLKQSTSETVLCGGVGLKLDEELIISYTIVDLNHSDMTLSSVAPLFIQAVTDQRQLCQNILQNKTTVKQTGESSVQTNNMVITNGLPWLKDQQEKSVTNNTSFDNLTMKK